MINLDALLSKKLVFYVGTAFMPSGDSSPCTASSLILLVELLIRDDDRQMASTRLLPGFVLVHGDESPDAIKSSPYPLAGFIDGWQSATL